MHGVAADRARRSRRCGGAGTPRTRARYSFSHRAAGELPDEGAVGLVVLGDHEQARGPLVEAVDDARPEDAADAGEVAHVREQRVHERARGACRRPGERRGPAGLSTTSRWRVLVDDGERDVLGLRLGGAVARGRRRGRAVAGAQPGRGPRAACRRAGRGPPSISACRRAREREGSRVREPDVEPLARGLIADDELVSSGARRRVRGPQPRGPRVARPSGLLGVTGGGLLRRDRLACGRADRRTATAPAAGRSR